MSASDTDRPRHHADEREQPTARQPVEARPSSEGGGAEHQDHSRRVGSRTSGVSVASAFMVNA